MVVANPHALQSPSIHNTYADIGLPTKAELKRLPLRAMLALACRCVRRVQRFYSSAHPACPRAIERGIQAAEQYARGEALEVNGGELRFATKHARNRGSKFVAQAVTYLAHAALYANRNQDEADADAAAYQAAMAIVTAYNADSDLSFLFAARDDFDYISVVVPAVYPQQGPSIDASEAGAMGPLWQGAA